MSVSDCRPLSVTLETRVFDVTIMNVSEEGVKGKHANTHTSTNIHMDTCVHTYTHTSTLQAVFSSMKG